MPADLPRRAFLGLTLGAAAAAATGCGRVVAGRQVATAATSSYADVERRLIAGYDALLPLASGADRALLRRLRAQHLEHLDRLGGGGTQAVEHIHSAAQLSAKERASAGQLTSAAVAAASGTMPAPALLASIAASHAAHADLLAGVQVHRRSRRTRRQR